MCEEIENTVKKQMILKLYFDVNHNFLLLLHRHFIYQHKYKLYF